MNKSKLFAAIIIIGTAILSHNVLAGSGYVSGVRLQSIGVVGPGFPDANHKAGNMEISIAGGFTLPAGVSCDRNYITTLKASDPDGAMRSLLYEAYRLSKAVTLTITDSITYNAYPGRCSLVAVWM